MKWTFGFALLALVVGFAYTHRHLALRIPRFGFVVHFLLGGALPPYTDPEIFASKYQSQWQSPKDVFASVPAKSGTTWLMNTLHHIRYRGSPKPFRDLYEECRWPEFVYYPGQPMEERIQVLINSTRLHPFPIFKTHFGTKLTQLRPDAKYIIQTRNVVDAATSLYSFFRSVDAGYAKMWGGFPPGAGEEEQAGDMAKFEHAMLVDMGNGRPMLDVLVLDVIADLWPHRNLPNVLFLHYSNRLHHAQREIAKLAEFLQVAELSEEEMALVDSRTSFAAMKRESHRFDLKFVHEPYRERGLVPSYVKAVAHDLVRHGPEGTGKTELSDEFKRKVRDHVQRRLGKEIARWLEEGGARPDVELVIGA